MQSYPKKTVNLHTSDGETIIQPLHVLKSRFQLIADLSDETVDCNDIDLAITVVQLYAALYACDTLSYPTTDEYWIELAEVFKYLLITEHWTETTCLAMSQYLKNRDKPKDVPHKYSYEECLAKIKDPTYLTKRELEKERKEREKLEKIKLLGIQAADGNTSSSGGTGPGPIRYITGSTGSRGVTGLVGPRS